MLELDVSTNGQNHLQKVLGCKDVAVPNVHCPLFVFEYDERKANTDRIVDFCPFL